MSDKVRMFAGFEIPSDRPLSGTVRYFSNSTGSISITGSFYFLDSSGSVEGIAYESLCRKLMDTFDFLVYQRFHAELSADNRLLISGSSPYTFWVDWLDNGTPQQFGLVPGAVTTEQSQITGSYVPHYMWISQYQGRSNHILPYEPEPFYFDEEADDGSAFSIGRSGSAIYSDWKFALEPKEKVYTKHASGTIQPYAWEDFIKHCRSTEPFIIFTGSSTVFTDKEHAYRFLDRSSNFRPESPFAHNHFYFDINCAVRVLGDE